MQPNAPRPGFDPRQQLQQLQQQAHKATSSQEMIAAASCVVGGALVLLLSLIGGAADVGFLLDSGYGWLSFGFYLFVVPVGVAVWRQFPLAIYVALGLVGLELAIAVLASYGVTGQFPGWLIVLKGLIFLLLVQAVYQPGGDDDAQQPPGGHPGYPPQQQQWRGPGPGPRQ